MNSNGLGFIKQFDIYHSKVPLYSTSRNKKTNEKKFEENRKKQNKERKNFAKKQKSKLKQLEKDKKAKEDHRDRVCFNKGQYQWETNKIEKWYETTKRKLLAEKAEH